MERTVRPAHHVIVLVDDSAGNRQVMARLLSMIYREGGVTVIEGACRADAIRLRFSVPAPDLMIINGLMPELSPDETPERVPWRYRPAEAGPAAIAEIRRLEAEAGLARVPIVIESGDEFFCRQGVTAGADEQFGLPIHASEFEAVVHRVFGEPPDDAIERDRMARAAAREATTG